MEKRGAVSTVTFTRPSNTTPYTAGDIVGATLAALTFPNISPHEGPVMITGATLRIDRATVIASEAAYTLHLYSVSPPSAPADNAVFDVPSGDRASYLGSISLGTPVDLGATAFVKTDGINAQFHPSGRNLYGLLTTVGGYTPESATVYTIALHAIN